MFDVQQGCPKFLESHASNSKLEIGPKHEGTYAKFQVNLRLFYHVRSALKTSGLPIKMAFGGLFRGPMAVVKRPRMDLKLGIPSRFGPISSLEFEA